MHERWFVGLSGWSAFVGASACLIRLCIGSDWPVVVKWDRWEYGLKVAYSLFWFGWAMMILYWKY